MARSLAAARERRGGGSWQVGVRWRPSGGTAEDSGQQTSPAFLREDGKAEQEKRILEEAQLPSGPPRSRCREGSGRNHRGAVSSLVLEPRGARARGHKGDPCPRPLDGQTAPGKSLCIRISGLGRGEEPGRQLQRTEHSGVRRRPEPVSRKREGKGKCQ